MRKIVDAETWRPSQNLPRAGNARSHRLYNHIIPGRWHDAAINGHKLSGESRRFERHYGRKPLGFLAAGKSRLTWKTLLFLAETGIQYTVLTGKQVQGIPGRGRRWAILGRTGETTKKIAVFRAAHDDFFRLRFPSMPKILGGGRPVGAQWVLGPARKNMGAR